MADDLDEIALNFLLADGIDSATAVAASIRDKPPAAGKRVRLAWWIGAVAGIVTVLIYAISSR